MSENVVQKRVEQALRFEGDVVAVPREMLLIWLGCTANYGVAQQMEDCLDAPPVRVVGAGEFVISAADFQTALLNTDFRAWAGWEEIDLGEGS